jgi:biotin carboxylase
MKPMTAKGDATAEAAAALTAALGGRQHISAQRFTSAYRTCYTGPNPIEAMRPALAIGCYQAWEPASPHQVIAAEQTTGVRSALHRHHWLDEIFPVARSRVEAMAAPAVVTGWFATRQLRALSGPGGTVAAVDGALRARLEDKAEFARFLQEACVPREAQISAVRIGGPLPSLTELRRLTGTSRVVVQSGVSSGGRGTVIVSGEDDMAAAAAMQAPYRVAAFVDGWSANITVLSVPRPDGGVNVYADRPSHKAIAVGALGIGPGKSAGNDWSQPWPAAAAATMTEAAVRIGEWAWQAHGMAGLFGLDAILTADGQVKINELNCRNQGTTELSAVNQQIRGAPPFVVAHLVTMLGGHPDWLGDPGEFNHATLGCATSPGPGPFYAKIRLTSPVPGRVPAWFPGPGVYRLDSQKLQWVRPGAHPALADADAGELLIASAPGPGIICHPGTEIATLEGITCGAGRPFTGTDTASAQVLAFAEALVNLLTPAPDMKEPSA